MITGAARLLAAVRAVPGVLACDALGNEVSVLVSPDADPDTVLAAVEAVAAPCSVRLLSLS